MLYCYSTRNNINIGFVCGCVYYINIMDIVNILILNIRYHRYS